jgi:hypothetical protein
MCMRWPAWMMVLYYPFIASTILVKLPVYYQISKIIENTLATQLEYSLSLLCSICKCAICDYGQNILSNRGNLWVIAWGPCLCARHIQWRLNLVLIHTSMLVELVGRDATQDLKKQRKCEFDMLPGYYYRRRCTSCATGWSSPLIWG